MQIILQVKNENFFYQNKSLIQLFSRARSYYAGRILLNKPGFKIFMESMGIVFDHEMKNKSANHFHNNIREC